MTEKKIRSIFVIEPSLKARAEKLAKSQGLTYSALIRKLLLDYVGGDLTVQDEIDEIKRRLDELEKAVYKNKK